MNKLIIIDGNSLLNRAFYAVPPNLTTKDGQHTNAVYGFCNMLIKLAIEEKPTYMTVAFDIKKPTFRHKMYENYKATRKSMPTELASQLPLIKKVLSAMNICILEKEGFEADDIIGTLSKKFNEKCIILTGDKDALQLVSNSTEVWLTKKGISELEKYSLQNFESLTQLKTPEQIVHLKALMGDASDNIPGVTKVGEKTALSLLQAYSTLDSVYEHIEEQKGKLKENLVNDKQLAYLSYELATIDTAVDVDAQIDKMKFVFPFSGDVYSVFEELQFKSLINKQGLFDSVIKAKPQIQSQTINIESESDFNELISAIKSHSSFALLQNQYINIAINENINYKISITDNLIDTGINEEYVVSTLKKLFCDNGIKKVLYDAKTLMHKYNIGINNFDDIMILQYLTSESNDIQNACQLISDLTNQKSKIDNYSMHKLYDLELQTAVVLYEIEKAGFKVDIDLLQQLKGEFGEKISKLSDLIQSYAGKTFNVNSPKQLAEVLYDDLKLLPSNKKRSTDIDVLNSIKNAHPIVNNIIEYRQYNKLYGTYITGLETLLDKNNKLHTIFLQTQTATGRLSSTEPNLQNIPIRTKEGGLIRKMFIPSCKEHILVGADYSQIELRLMAHYSGDELLINALSNNVDIHAQTASIIFDVNIENVTDQMRRQAKAVNFGIIYGISDFGLSTDLGISVYEARRYMEKYFSTHPKVKEFMNSCVEKAKRDGYIQTIMNRRRYFPQINSSNYNIRSFNERASMNTPLQGSASDIMKVAMVNVSNLLKEKNLQSKLILQVHDELVIDALISEKDEVATVLKNGMENVIDLKVPLTIEVYTGENWLQIQ